MADLHSQFEQAQANIKTLTQRPTNDELLALYALFKQATEGDVSGKRPGMFDFKGAAKYDAWEQLKGTNAENAMQQYIDKVAELATQYA
ncbi:MULTISPECIES: acyl-CoA-binding protein [Photobacterium]|uniref:Acyl-CoA-binding protein n=1 Tax=Photobacterium ganghwense TaxID=320778 RepID=A0A0J1HAV8_9GAMM|nr:MULTISPECIES: acyl-CoA-binding protein [Photobacterium]KLV08766.1 acyl-CoA-binding protein [Photobacterium ganghwense]MBV1840944.1 acyl-CoA-binding protein [Photobacterium ganghwense]PSU10894.1 acyl-CoA-binding protein [Photobacterium ganghwense]QSV12997.1 acyl-CoA-binding protein [Photobacterium ganghwense]